MLFTDGQEYTKDCRDFAYTGVKCCSVCHEDHLRDYELEIIIIDGEVCLVCCQLKAFFYPPDPNRKLSPEEKLLRAIFGEGPHEQPGEEID